MSQISQLSRPMTGLVRRVGQIPTLGITEPIQVQEPYINAPIKPLPGPQRLNVENKAYQQRLIASQRERQLPELEIESVGFSLFSTEEIDKYAVVKLTSPKSTGSGTVRDLKMGPQTDSEPCGTCSKDIRGCNGHFGKIDIPRLMHPQLVRLIIDVLTCVCNSCSRLLVTRQELEREGITRLFGLKRVQLIRVLVDRLQRLCQRYVGQHNVVHCQHNPIYLSFKENSDDYNLSYTFKGREKEKPFPRSPKQIYEILDHIPDEDAELLGFTFGSHPRTLAINRLMVISYCARPDVYHDGKLVPDDLTTIYAGIIGRVKEYEEKKDKSEYEEQALLKDIWFRISHFMKNEGGKMCQNNGKPFTDLKDRLQGKNALIRGYMMGKRVNFAGRTVVGPGSYLRVDQVGVPARMAVNLTRPLLITEFNRAELQSKFEQGRVTYIESNYGKYAGQKVMITDDWKERYPDYQLKIGDTAHRMLEDGDITIVNRQPSLHKQNMLALRSTIIEDRILRTNLSVTSPMNLDYDGR